MAAQPGALKVTVSVSLPPSSLELTNGRNTFETVETVNELEQRSCGNDAVGSKTNG